MSLSKQVLVIAHNDLLARQPAKEQKYEESQNNLKENQESDDHLNEQSIIDRQNNQRIDFDSISLDLVNPGGQPIALNDCKEQQNESLEQLSSTDSESEIQTILPAENVLYTQTQLDEQLKEQQILYEEVISVLKANLIQLQAALQEDFSRQKEFTQQAVSLIQEAHICPNNCFKATSQIRQKHFSQPSISPYQFDRQSLRQRKESLRAKQKKEFLERVSTSKNEEGIEQGIKLPNNDENEQSKIIPIKDAESKENVLKLGSEEAKTKINLKQLQEKLVLLEKQLKDKNQELGMLTDKLAEADNKFKDRICEEEKLKELIESQEKIITNHAAEELVKGKNNHENTRNNLQKLNLHEIVVLSKQTILELTQENRHLKSEIDKKDEIIKTNKECSCRESQYIHKIESVSRKRALRKNDEVLENLSDVDKEDRIIFNEQDFESMRRLFLEVYVKMKKDKLYAEEIAINAKIQLAEVSMSRDFFEHNFKRLLSQSK